MPDVGSIYDFRLYDADLDPQAQTMFAAQLHCVRPYQPGRDVWIVGLNPALHSTEYHDSRELLEYAALMARHAGANINESDRDWMHVYVLRSSRDDIVEQQYTTPRTTPEWWALIKARPAGTVQ